MYLESPETIQALLNEDWTIVLKNLRFREDLYQQILHSNHRINQKQCSKNEKQHETFQVQQLQSLINKINKQQNQMDKQQQGIMEKYEGAATSFQSCIKLLGRIGAKVLQLLKTASDRSRSLETTASARYNHFRSVLIAILTQKEKIKLEEVFKVVLDYSKQKLLTQLKKLQTKVIYLQNGQNFDQIQLINEKKCVAAQQKTRENHFFLKNKQASENLFSKQDKSQYKKNQKSKRKTMKMSQNPYTIMGLSKNKPAEQTLGQPQKHSQKLYQQLLTRNKLNLNQIVVFINKYEEPQTKPENFKGKIANKFEIQNKSMGFICQSKKNATQSRDFNQRDDYFQYIATEIDCNTIDNLNQMAKNHIKKLQMTRTKIASPLLKKEDFPHLSIKMNNQLLTSIKADFSKHQRNQNIISRLPIIKRGSLDHKAGVFNPKTTLEGKQTIDNVEQTSLKVPKRQSFFRQQRIASQRAKVVLKSVQVGLDISSKKGQRFCKQEQQSYYERKKTDTTIESTIYMRKTINKFLDNKLNLFL